VPGNRLRTLLIILALHPGRVVPATHLIDGIWPGRPPAQAANALQTLVSRLRRTIPGAVIESRPNGYRLVLDQDKVDVIRFERLVSPGRSASTHEPALREALATSTTSPGASGTSSSATCMVTNHPATA
jgi:DNA-binding SARP family transcriptional activator